MEENQYSDFELQLNIALDPKNADVEVEIQELENELRQRSDFTPYELNAVCRLKRDILVERKKQEPDEGVIDKLEAQLFDVIHGKRQNFRLDFSAILDTDNTNN